jgi:hypothetical protein
MILIHSGFDKFIPKYKLFLINREILRDFFYPESNFILKLSLRSLSKVGEKMANPYSMSFG